MSKLQSLSTRKLSTFVHFTLFEVYLLPLSRGVCWFTMDFQGICVHRLVFSTRCQVDKSFTRTSSMPCWDLIIHILPLGAAWVRWSFHISRVEAMNFGIGNEEIHGKDYEKSAIDCIQDSELASRSLPFWDRTLWQIDKDNQMLKMVWHLFWGSIIFDLSLGNWKSTYRCFHLHLPQPRWSF